MENDKKRTDESYCQEKYPCLYFDPYNDICNTPHGTKSPDCPKVNKEKRREGLVLETEDALIYLKNGLRKIIQINKKTGELLFEKEGKTLGFSSKKGNDVERISLREGDYIIFESNSGKIYIVGPLTNIDDWIRDRYRYFTW